MNLKKKQININDLPLQLRKHSNNRIKFQSLLFSEALRILSITFPKTQVPSHHTVEICINIKNPEYLRRLVVSRFTVTVTRYDSSANIHTSKTYKRIQNGFFTRDVTITDPSSIATDYYLLPYYFYFFSLNEKISQVSFTSIVRLLSTFHHSVAGLTSPVVSTDDN